jgi:CheY-like chemotaxis protein/HPt (histidine-containing phosphotransfer) domain-containing protein
MADQEVETHRPSAEAHRIVVLLIDDQAFVGAAISRLLATEEDIDFHHCRQALDAIALANQIRPTVILQDLRMPDMDGLTLVRSFRTNPQTAGTPVIVLSGNEDRDARTQALAHGAKDYLVKLPSKENLLACIRRYANACAAVNADSVSAAPPGQTAAPDRAAGQTLDRSTIEVFRQADTAGSSVFMSTLIDQFLDEAASQVARLSEAARRVDVDELQAIAHGLKGSATTMGANKLAALCGQMERHAARQAKGVAVSILMAEIEQELVHVQDALAVERQRTDQQ